MEHRAQGDPRRGGGSIRVSRFPGWTHLLLTLAFPAWAIGTDARLYGIDTTDTWWQGFGDLMPVLTLGILVVVAPPAVALEAWAVARLRSRWPARAVVAGYVLVAGCVAFVPTGLRFFGDTSPTPVADETLALAVFAIVAGAEVLAAYAACRVWTSRRPEARPSSPR